MDLKGRIKGKINSYNAQRKLRKATERETDIEARQEYQKARRKAKIRLAKKRGYQSVTPRQDRVKKRLGKLAKSAVKTYKTADKVGQSSMFGSPPTIFGENRVRKPKKKMRKKVTVYY